MLFVWSVRRPAQKGSLSSHTDRKVSPEAQPSSTTGFTTGSATSAYSTEMTA